MTIQSKIIEKTPLNIYVKSKEPEDNPDDHSHHNHYTNNYGDVCNCSMPGQSQFLLFYYQVT